MKTKFIKTNILFLLLFSTTTAQGALLHPLNDVQVIEATISRQGLTRIAVKQDRILNVFGVTGEYVLETDEDQGQVFIRPMGPGSLNPISLTLTTENGHTQDLRLIPKDKSPEALILQADNTTQEELLRNKLAHTLPSREEIEELLEGCQMGRIPVGYKLMPLGLKSTEGFHRLIREIRNDNLRGLTYEVKNSGTIPWILAESGFAQKLDVRVVAILMPQKLLNPGEGTHVYVIAKVTH